MKIPVIRVSENGTEDGPLHVLFLFSGGLYSPGMVSSVLDIGRGGMGPRRGIVPTGRRAPLRGRAGGRRRRFI